MNKNNKGQKTLSSCFLNFKYSILFVFIFDIIQLGWHSFVLNDFYGQFLYTNSIYFQYFIMTFIIIIYNLYLYFNTSFHPKLQ